MIQQNNNFLNVFKRYIYNINYYFKIFQIIFIEQLRITKNKDKVAFIAGGTGIVGGGIAVELLKNGCKVWVSSRNESKLIQFKDNLQDDLKTNLGTIKGEVETETECEKIRDYILSVDNKIDYVVSSLGLIIDFLSF